MREVTPYNPLRKENLGESVADALLKTPREPLNSLEGFTGAGIYAIYYDGDFPAYEPIRVSEEQEVPIYIGKAVPSGARKGNVGLDANTGSILYKRVMEHAKSIELAGNLRPEDFSYRYLVVEDIWIPLGESLLISRFSPLWNTFIDGFGNHNPGKGRYRQIRSRWDTLHSGRQWALNCQPRTENAEQIKNEVIAYLS